MTRSVCNIMMMMMVMVIIIIIMKRIYITTIYNTRWELRSLNYNINNTRTHQVSVNDKTKEPCVTDSILPSKCE